MHAGSVEIADLLASFHLRRTKRTNLCKGLSFVSLAVPVEGEEEAPSSLANSPF